MDRAAGPPTGAGRPPIMAVGGRAARPVWDVVWCGDVRRHRCPRGGAAGAGGAYCEAAVACEA
ncbi:hypothetical protein B7760_02104 [Burkholderia glumae]|nr:hypothetical protein B7760_02104 [Burkholderia glumae]